jgi:hypothetical protein
MCSRLVSSDVSRYVLFTVGLGTDAQLAAGLTPYQV